MPKVVVNAPTSHRGIGLHHLTTEEGLQKIMNIIKHLQAKTTLGKLMNLLLLPTEFQPVSQSMYSKTLLFYHGHCNMGLQIYVNPYKLYKAR